MVGASGQLYSVDFYGKRLLFCLVVVVVMMGVVTGVIQGHQSIQGHKQRGSVTISTSETSHSNTIGRHSRLLRGLGSTSELERESKANNHLQSSPVNDNDRMDTRADETRDVCFPFVVMWIQRRQAAGYTAPDDDEGVASRAKAPLPSPGREWWCSHGSPRGGIKAGTRLRQTDGAASRDLPLLISLILTCAEARRSCQGR